MTGNTQTRYQQPTTPTMNTPLGLRASTTRQYRGMAAEILRLRQRHAEAVALLADVEWAGTDLGVSHAVLRVVRCQ